MHSTPLQGVGVCPGRVHAPAVWLVSNSAEPSPAPVEADVQVCIERIAQAAEQIAADLNAKADRAEGSAQELLRTTAQIAQDPTLLREAGRLVQERRITAERAVWESAGAVTEKFASLGGYFAERVADVCDVRDRLIAALTGSEMPGVPHRTEPFILVAPDLSPADTAVLDRSVVLGLIIAEGGPTSHTAILARDLGIPAVVGLGTQTEEIAEGHRILLDGAAGTVQLDPDQDVVTQALAPTRRRGFDGRGHTADGVDVALMANVGDPAAAAEAAASGAQGVGLFRTEFCFLDREHEPEPAEQVRAYRQVLAAFAGRTVVVRTLDAGADKPMPFLSAAPEANPALGVRGYRTVRSHPEVLERQLEAIACAARAEDASVWVMAPMVTTVAEAEDFVARAAAHGLERAGVMVETPAAALLAGPILARAQFASIGTNDLTQYTLAADRLLGSLARMATTWDPSVLHLVQATCRGAEAQDRPVSVCGEAAADPALAVVLVGLGVRSLSMTPRALGDVAAALEHVTLAKCEQAATLALASESEQDARAAVRAHLPVLAELGL